ncbi:hypothetical protein TNCV_4175931 [Trichonephila clavipes]|nr:hypothetical protein TNCV_4175931 [Trichonephila clavipes]
MMISDRGPRDSLRPDVLLSLAVYLTTIQLTVRFGSVHRNFEEEYPIGGQGPPTSFTLAPTSREKLRLDGYLECPHAAQPLYIYKYPCLLRDLNSGPTA